MTSKAGDPITSLGCPVDEVLLQLTIAIREQEFSQTIGSLIWAMIRAGVRPPASS